MGQWKLAIYFRLHIGVLLSISKERIIIYIPFVQIYIGLMDCAKGFFIELPK